MQICVNVRHAARHAASQTIVIVKVQCGVTPFVCRVSPTAVDYLPHAVMAAVHALLPRIEDVVMAAVPAVVACRPLLAVIRVRPKPVPPLHRVVAPSCVPVGGHHGVASESIAILVTEAVVVVAAVCHLHNRVVVLVAAVCHLHHSRVMGMRAAVCHLHRSPPLGIVRVTHHHLLLRVVFDPIVEARVARPRPITVEDVHNAMYFHPYPPFHPTRIAVVQEVEVIHRRRDAIRYAWARQGFRGVVMETEGIYTDVVVVVHHPVALFYCLLFLLPEIQKEPPRVVESVRKLPYQSPHHLGRC